ncbi:hypothetical protein GCM10027162_62770 [Streptomyces incanus]
MPGGPEPRAARQVHRSPGPAPVTRPITCPIACPPSTARPGFPGLFGGWGGSDRWHVPLGGASARGGEPAADDNAAEETRGRAGRPRSPRQIFLPFLKAERE